MSQLGLFGEEPPGPSKQDAQRVEPADVPAELGSLGDRLPARLHMGTSSWSFPGWRGIVYRGQHKSGVLSKNGLQAYGQHPLLNAVGVDRTFYAPVEAEVLAGYAQQVDDGFSFLVKAPGELTMPTIKDKRGAVARNLAFLDPARALRDSVRPAVEGLGSKLGVVLVQFPPLALGAVGGPLAFAERLEGFFAALPRARYAVEVRTPALLCPRYFEVLRRHGVEHCCVVFPGMPSLAEQFERSGGADRRALVVRWMLGHGLRYQEARDRYLPFDRLAAPDVPTREMLAQILRSVDAPKLVIVNNKAEGCSPLSLRALAESIVFGGGATPRAPA